MLVLQSLFTAIVTGAEASPLERDFLGNVICSSSGADSGHSRDLPPQQHHDLDCCTLGCSMFSPLASAQPDLVWIPAAVWRDAALPSWEKRRLAAHSRDYSPSNPRAPPVIA